MDTQFRTDAMSRLKECTFHGVVFGLCLLLSMVFFSHVTYAAEATIDSTAVTTNPMMKMKPALVFTSDQNGYMFYRDSDGSFGYSKTTNGGTSWGAPVNTTAQADIAIFAMWYDRWTPGDSGTIIHIVMADTGNDDVWYDTVNTSNDSQGTEVAMSTVAGNTFTQVDNVTISKGTNGNLYIGFCDAAAAAACTIRRCTGTCTTAGNWVSPGTSPIDVANDFIRLFPLASGDMLLVRDDISANDIQSKKYTVGTTTWDASWTNIDIDAPENATYPETLTGTVDLTSNDIYLAYIGNVAGAGTADVRTAVYSGGSWTVKTEVVSNQSTIIALDIALDDRSKDVYVGYLRGTAGSSCNAYYKRSIDGMGTWEGETQFNTTGNDLRYVYLNTISDERIYGAYYRNATTDGLFGNTIADISAADLTYTLGSANFLIYQSSALTWGAGTLACTGTLTDTNGDTINCTDGAGINGSTQYRVDVQLKNTGGTTLKMNGASDYVDNIAVKAGWAGSNPTLGNCAFSDDGSDNGSTTCTAAYNATNNVRITNTGAENVNIKSGENEGFMYLITTAGTVSSGDANSYSSSSIDGVTQSSSKVRVVPVYSVSVSDGVVSYGYVAVGGTQDTTSSGMNDTQTATNDGVITESLNIKGNNTSCWTLAGTPGSEQYAHEFCTTGSGSPDVCDATPTWTALTTNYQTLATSISASGTQKFDTNLKMPSSTNCYTQQSVDVTIQAVAP